MGDWQNRRTFFLVFGLIQQSLCQLEIAAVTISLLRYYKDIIQVHNPKVFYGVAMSAIFVAGVLSSKFCGYYMDKSRNIRRIAFVTLLLNLFGNILYSLPFSKWLPIVGRFLCGINEGLRTAIIGELSRVYDKPTLAKHLTSYQIVTSASVLLAPLSPLLFTGVNTRIGFLPINQYNGIVLACISGVLWTISLFFLPNLTLDPYFKIVKNEICNENYDVEERKESHAVKIWTTGDIIKNSNLRLLILTECILAYNYFQTELLINLVAMYYFNWSMGLLAKLFSIIVAISSTLLILNQRYIVNSPVNIFYLYTSCFPFIAICHSLINLIIAMEINGTYLQVVLFGFSICCHLFQGYGSTAYIRWLLFALSPKHSASVVESHRYIVAKSSGFVAFLTAGFVISKLYFVLPLYNFICFLGLSLMVVYRNDILNKLCHNSYQ